MDTVNYTENLNVKQVIIIENLHLHLSEGEQEVQDDEIEEDQIRKLLKEQYEPKKRTNMFLADAYNMTTMDNAQQKARRLASCSRWLEFAFHAETEKYKLVKTSSCHVRLCPVCQWRRSLNTFRNLARIYTDPRVKKHKHIFLTLTQRNVPGSELGAELAKISKAFTNFMRRKELKFVLGYTKTTEVTRAKDGSYHPHIHAILTVPRSYGSREYISQQEIRRLWDDVQELGYDPQCDIRRISQRMGKTVAEVSKYSVKPADYIAKTREKTADVIEELDPALDGKRFVSCGGLIREVKKDLMGQKDIEADAEPVEDFANWEKIIYEWHFGDEKYIRI